MIISDHLLFRIFLMFNFIYFLHLFYMLLLYLYVSTLTTPINTFFYGTNDEINKTYYMGQREI